MILCPASPSTISKTPDTLQIDLDTNHPELVPGSTVLRKGFPESLLLFERPVTSAGGCLAYLHFVAKASGFGPFQEFRITIHKTQESAIQHLRFFTEKSTNCFNQPNRDEQDEV